MNRKILIPFLILLLGGSLLADRRTADPMEGVRYVDVQVVLEGWTALQQESLKVQARFQQLRDELEVAADALTGAQEDLELLEPSSEAYLDAAFHVTLQEQTLTENAKYLQAKFQRENTQLVKDGVLRIHEACAELGAREGYSAILMTPTPLPGAGVDPAESVLDLQGRWVVWSNPNYDVSAEVLAILNNSQL